jgi:hypothetical protein
MKLTVASFIASLAICASQVSYCQTDSTSKRNKKVKVLPVPSFGYAPETKTYVGAVALFTLDLYQDSLTRVSNAKAEFNYTWRRQVILETGWNYFFEREQYYSQGLIHYSKYPDFYYGVGEATTDSQETRYESKRIIADINALKRVGNKVFAGPKIVYKNYYSLSTNIINADARLSDGDVLRVGFTVLKDTRDNLLNAWSGTYLELSNTYSLYDKRYAKLHLDLRKYEQLHKRVVAAGRLYNEFTFGTPHFYDYAIIGGDKFTRGFFYGRFREKNFSTLQAELRANVIWRLGVAVFGGATKLYPELNQFSFNNIKPNYGAGIRFLIDRKSNINLRFDYAQGSDGQDGFYVAFGESF